MDEYGTCLCQDCVTSVTRLDEYGARECHECVTSVSGLKLVWVEFGKIMTQEIVTYVTRTQQIIDSASGRVTL